jgi:hypothetical protein
MNIDDGDDPKIRNYRTKRKCGINVETPRDELVRGLRMVLGSAASVQGVRLGGTRVNDQFVEDAYLYRLSPLRSSVSSSKTNHTKSKKLTPA